MVACCLLNTFSSLMRCKGEEKCLKRGKLFSGRYVCPRKVDFCTWICKLQLNLGIKFLTPVHFCLPWELLSNTLSKYYFYFKDVSRLLWPLARMPPFRSRGQQQWQEPQFIKRSFLWLFPWWFPPEGGKKKNKSWILMDVFGRVIIFWGFAFVIFA